MNQGTSHDIYIASMKMFHEHGFENVTVQAICEECRITKKTFYYHYRSKENILLNFYDEMFSHVIDALPEIIKEKRAVDRLWKCMDAGTDVMLIIGAELFRNVIISDLKNKAGINSLENNSDDTYQRVTREYAMQAQSNGEIRSGDITSLMRAYHSSVLGILLTWVNCDGNFDLQKELKQSFELIYQCQLNP